MPEQSEGNNHTSKINVFPVLYTIFFLLAGQKVDLFAPHGAMKSALCPASRKKLFFALGLTTFLDLQLLGCPRSNCGFQIQMSLTIFLNDFCQYHDFFLLAFFTCHS